MNEGLAKQKQRAKRAAPPPSWRNRGKHNHVVQYYKSDERLIESLAQTLIDSLRAGETCVIIATTDHQEALAGIAAAKGVDLDSYINDGQFIALDADGTLESFMVNGKPQWRKFDKTVGGVLQKAVQRDAPVRAYGEMVALLWQRGQQDAAIELERLWNRLATKYDFVLHCAYPIRDVAATESIAAISKGQAHYLGTQFRQVVRPRTRQTQLQQEVARRERAEHALQVAEADRKQLQELSAIKDEYLSIASHQLRTPATIVKQYLAMLLDGYDGTLTPGQREKVRLAFESNERQLKIINDLLMVASAEAGTLRLNRQACDVGRLIHDVAAEQAAEVARRSQTLELILPPLPNIQADVRYIRMVLENLVSNASKYSPRETSITVSAGLLPGNVFIAVADKGIGISKKDQERLYKKFSRIDGHFTHSIEGTGLGLYWVKKIVELHGGTLSLKSRVNHGSTFTVTLPLSG